MARQLKGMRQLALAVACMVVLVSGGALDASDVGWRARVAPTLLERFDAYEEGIQSLWVQVADPGTSAHGLTGGNYAYRALTAWSQLRSDTVAQVHASASDARLWVTASPGQTFWEAPLSYFLSSGVLWVQADLSNLQRLAEIPGVIFISDAGLPAPIGRASVFSGAMENDALSLGGLLEKTDLPAEDLGRLTQAQEGVILSREQIRQWSEASSEKVLSALPSLDADLGAFTPISYAMQHPSDHGVLAPSDVTEVELAPWKVALSQGDLRQLLDLLDWEGADIVTLFSMAYEDETVPLAVLWRSTDPSALSSLDGGPSTISFVEPDSPGELLATQGAHDDQVVLLWPEIPGIGLYEVLRADCENGVYTPAAVVDGTSYVDRDVETCSITWYRVRSLDPHGLGEPASAGFGYIGQVPFPVDEIRSDGGAVAGAIRVEWTPSEGATYYRLLRNQYMTGSSTVRAQNYTIVETEETFFVDTDVVVGQTYLYRVFAHNGCGRSKLSRPTEGIAYFDYPSNEPLHPPSWIEATRGTPYGQVKLTWTAVPGAVEYRILRSLTYEGPYELFDVSTDLRWTDEDVELCGDYWYRVQTVTESGVSEPSASAYGSYGYRPTAPGHVQASIGAHPDSIRIEWAPVEDTRVYNIQRAPAEEGPYTPIASTEETFFVDRGLSPGQQFWYAVTASNPCGCSGAQGAVMGMTAYE